MPPCMQVQDRAEDWSLGSRGCYDAVSLTRLQMQLRYDFQGVAQVAAGCFDAVHSMSTATTLFIPSLHGRGEVARRSIGLSCCAP